MILISLFSCFILVAIFVEDLRYRAVHWWLFPVLLGAFFFLEPSLSYLQRLQNFSINTAFLVLQFVLLFVYFSIREGKWTRLFNKYLGWGDVLLLFAAGMAFSPLNFICFYVSSLILVLAFSVVFFLMTGRPQSKIPLAGYQAALLCILLCVAVFVPQARPGSDDFLLSFFNL